MFGFIRNLFSRKAQPAVNGRSLSQLDAARTDRTNIYHWQNAKDVSINCILSRNLEVIRARSQWECINNSTIKGVVATLANDIVGGYGPKLQVVSDDADYNEILEQTWADWFASPDINGVLSGPEMLRTGVIDLCKSGDMIFILSDAKGVSGGVSLRLQAISPRRLVSPFSLVGDDQVFMGIRFSDTGKPLEYYIESFRNPEIFMPLGVQTKAYKAESVIHYFERIDAEQARGFPWLTPALPIISQSEEFEDSVLKTARTAAMFGVLLKPMSNETIPFTPGDQTDMESGMITTIPPGHDAITVNPNQPNSQYESFINSQRSKMGRPFCMPLIKVNLDARGHSWSSARSDTMSYHDHIVCIESEIERTVLNRLVDEVARESRLDARISLPERPLQVKYEWTWPVPSQVEPMKEAQAATERIVNGTSNLKIECGRMAEDWRAVIDQRAKEIEYAKARGISVEIVQPNTPAPANQKDDEDVNP